VSKNAPDREWDRFAIEAELGLRLDAARAHYKKALDNFQSIVGGCCRFIAKETRETGVPLWAYLVSASQPRRPTRIVVWTWGEI